MPRDNSVRQRVIDYLATNGPVNDKSGRATSVLKEAVGYVSSDAGFSQLIGAMERDGLLSREIRGKRTFSISGSAASPSSPEPPTATEAIDYDELAASLLVSAARALANAQEPTEAAGWARRRIQQLEGRVDELERELARAKAEATATASERDELRGQLEAASHNLTVLTEQSQRPRQGRAAQRLGSEDEALLLQLRGHRRRSGT